MNEIADVLLQSKQRRIWIVGNGGSAASSSHMASDLANLGFDTICMCDNVPRLTSLTNDYGWENVYTKQMEHFKEDDVLIVFSVHGGKPDWSNNLVLACELAKKKKGIVLALLGGDGGLIKNISDFHIIVPSNNCYDVEGRHSMIAHQICKRLKE